MTKLMTRLREIPAMDGIKPAVRAARRVYFPVQDRVIRIYAQLARRGDYVRELISGDDPLHGSRHEAVYVHYDPNGIVHDYVVHQLCELVGAGYRITFVSNSPNFPPESAARVQPLCRELIWRFNVGYDFGAYKDGIASISNSGQLDSLILMNDSVYGPFWSLRDTLCTIDRKNIDFWGIADSFEYTHHIQTFFMVFFPAALTSLAFKDFWRRLPYVNHKRWVIRNAEVRLTAALTHAGLKSSVLAPYWSVLSKMKSRVSGIDHSMLPETERDAFASFRLKIVRDRTVNPMQYFWNSLIEDYHCPFVKRELIQSNPAKIPFVERWPQVIAAQSVYDIAMIAHHLNR
jgi:lipopolysaccharide biosynthesis protein